MYTLIYMPILFLGMFADNALGTTFQMDVMVNLLTLVMGGSM